MESKLNSDSKISSSKKSDFDNKSSKYSGGAASIESKGESNNELIADSKECTSKTSKIIKIDEKLEARLDADADLEFENLLSQGKVITPGSPPKLLSGIHNRRSLPSSARNADSFKM